MTAAAEQIDTERLVLRPVRDDDAPALFDLLSRPEVARWSGSGVPLASIEEATDRIARYARRTRGRPGMQVFAITVRAEDDDRLRGVTVLLPLPDSDGFELDAVEIGWHLHPDVWGHGYATEAGAAMLQRAAAFGLAEVYAVTLPDNEPSQQVCRRLGMTDLGLREDWYDKTTRAFHRPVGPAPDPGAASLR